jgi:K+ transporter
MHLQRFHPLAGITTVILVAGTLANFFTLDWQRAPFSYGIGSLLLASPFAVLLVAHVTIARTWRRNIYLAVGSVLFIVPWLFISFAMRWFQGGWAGIAVGGAVLIVLAVGYLSLALLIGEK